MKTTILIAAVLSAATVFANAQTNSAAAKTTPAATTNTAPARPTLTASSAATSVVGDPKSKKLISAEKRTDVIEGRNHDFGGAIPRALGPERRNPLQLLNPFAPMTDRERRFSQRPPPRAFVDDRTIEPVGLTIISVEKK